MNLFSVQGRVGYSSQSIQSNQAQGLPSINPNTRRDWAFSRFQQNGRKIPHSTQGRHEGSYFLLSDIDFYRWVDSMR